MIIESAGAARTVTGSCHLLSTDHARILVDCGMFQGGRELSARNREPFPFDPADLSAVLVTHAHLDHVGRLPLLVKRGYGGKILATRATAEIATVILHDAAKLQNEDYRRELRKARRAGREDEVEPPLFDGDDVERTLARFEAVEMERDLDLGGAGARFRPAGHILGSTFVRVTADGGRVVFSGDLGNRESPLQAPAPAPEGCDAVLIETTYADRNHRGRDATEREFREVLAASLARGGNVLIPTFAVERTQGVLYEIRRLMQGGAIDRVPVFLDSPMATTMTKLYESCRNEFRPAVRDEIAAGRDPFRPDTLSFTVSTDESKAINDIEGGAIVLAGSGMMTGGRILHHLKHNLWREEASLIVVGYQAAGTLGRALVDGARRVHILGDEIAVRAGVHTINGFSAHADHDDLVAWLAGTGDAHAFLVHGEPDVMDAFAEERRASGRRVTCPEPGARYEL